jgi:hypothetical protein
LTLASDSDTDRPVRGETTEGGPRKGPPDVQEPTPAERVRALPLVSVALGSMALGFCLVYFVCKPGAADRATMSRPLAAPDASAEAPAAVSHGSAAELHTDVDAGAAPPSVPAAEAGTASPPPAVVPPPPAPVADAAPAAPPAPTAPPGLSLNKVDVRKCAGVDGVDVARERCVRVRGVDIFMARNEDAVRDCFEKSFAETERPAQFGVTLDVDFTAKTRRVSVPGADETRARQFGEFRACLEAGLGQPEYDRIDHPQATYRFFYLYDYAPPAP